MLQRPAVPRRGARKAFMTSPSPVTPAISVIILARGAWDETFRTLLAVVPACQGLRTETIVVDDATSDETRAALAQLEGLTVLRNESPHGPAAAMNQGAAAARGDYVAFLRGGCEPRPGWLAPLFALAEKDEDVAVVGSRTVTLDGLIEQDGIALAYASPWPLAPWRADSGEPAATSDEVSEVPAVSSAAMLVRRDVLEALDGFDEDLWDGGEDVDLCLRAADLGGKVLLARASVAVAPTAPALSARSAALLNRRWLGRAALFDPARRAERARPAPRAGRQPVSAVIPLCDALRTVATAAEDLLANLGADDELVLADAGSSDGTREFARLLVKERGHSVRLVPSDPAAGAAGAATAGLAEATRPIAVLVPPSVGAPEGFVDLLTSLLEQHRDYGVVAIPAGAAGYCAAGSAEVLRELGRSAPAALSGTDPQALDAAVRQAGSRLLVLGG
jgi:GT2 family glycosyltransferase